LSSDDDEGAAILNEQILELKRILNTNERILRGEDEVADTEGDLDALDGGESKLGAAERKRKQREEEAKKAQDDLDAFIRAENAKFEDNLDRQ
jgi:hypothetical protein